MRVLRAVATEVGRGLLAGLVGTAVMTVASTLEMKARKRPPSGAPAAAAGKVLGIEPRDEAGKRRLSNAVHFAYGTAWGLARSLVGASLRAARADSTLLAPAAHFAAVWTTGLLMLPALGVAPPVRAWGGKELALDALHHGVYAAAADLAYRAFDP